MGQDVNRLIKQSKDNTILIGVNRRREAVKKLGEIGTPEVVTPLYEALEDEDDEVKKFAFLALSGLSDPDSQEAVLRLYSRNRNPALWQIIKNNNFFPEDLPLRFSYFAKLEMEEKILEEIDQENFNEILDQLIEAPLDNPAQVLNVVIEKGGENVAMHIVRRFIETKNDNLFKLIDQKEWYPPETDKKLMFLLKTRRYEKVLSMLDGVDFRKVLDILINPEFPMKKYAREALSELKDPIIIDEICQIFITEDLPHLGELITDNHWSPTGHKEIVFFYFKTPFLQEFFQKHNIIVDMLGGYMNVPHVRENLTAEDYEKLAGFLKNASARVSAGEEVELPEDSPLLELAKAAREFIETPKDDKTIKEICDDYLYRPNAFLGNMIRDMGWSPVDLDERIIFFLRSGQMDKIRHLKESAVMPLYHIFKSEKLDDNIHNQALEALKTSDDPEVISRIFRLYFQTFDESVDKIIKENNWEPEKTTDRALYYVFSEQPEKYLKSEGKNFKPLEDAYFSLISQQRYKLVEILINSRQEAFVDFIIGLFEKETSPVVLELLGSIIKSNPDKVYRSLRSSIRNIEGPAVEMIVQMLARISTGTSLELLYYVARVKKGHICLWILKLLEEARWQPEAASEKVFYYDLFKLREEMVRVLQNRLVDEDPEIRAHSARTIAQMRDEKFLTSLMKYVEDPQEEVGAAIAHSMGKIFAVSPENALEQFNSFHIGSIYMIFNEVRKAFMVTSDEEQINILSRNYRSGQTILRHFCISAMEHLKKPQSLPTLELALQDSDKNIRLCALRTLKEIAEPESQKALYPMLDNEDPDVRMLAAQALAKIADADLMERIAKRLNLTEFLHSDGMIEMLSLREPQAHREFFLRVIRRPDYEDTAKHNSIVALARIGDNEALKVIVNELSTLTSSDVASRELLPYVRAFAEVGHSKIYKYLDKLSSRGNWQVRQGVIKAMAKIPDRIALVRIVKALDDYDGWVQIAALEALGEYFNHQFKFLMTEKDLRFVGAIIARLKKFQLNQVQDKHYPEYETLSKLNASLMQNELTRLYYRFRDKISKSKTEK